MLEPDTRQLLIDGLRPPDGWELVHAVGTTYSLDLNALLFAPLSFALFDWAIEDDGRPNVIALLESLRRYADRTTLFCQAGQVGVPRDYQPLMVHLEDCVVPVTAPDPERIFHPKLWVLRFRDVDGLESDRYRILCLTRNLTFDTSWDTVLVLDGERRAGGDTVAQNRPLVSFLEALVDHAPHTGAERAEAIRGLAGDIADVRFDAPDGFDSVRFHPLGLADGGWPVPDGAERVLIMSPFLTAGALERLRAGAGGGVLISRQESLDAVGRGAVAGYSDTYVLADAATQTDALSSLDDTGNAPGAGRHGPDEARGGAVDSGLSGLHAKMFVAEFPGGEKRFYTGSANATDAAFGGNVEFLVEMRTRQRGVGISSLLDYADGQTSLRDLLQEYTPRDEPSELTDADEVERILDIARRRVGALTYTSTLTPIEDGEGDAFRYELVGDGPLDVPEGVTGLQVWPLSLAQGHHVRPSYDRNGFRASFGRIARSGITSFFAIEIAATVGAVVDRVRFIVNAELVGAPEGRKDQVITDILRDRQDLLRYLLFLLADTSGGFSALMEQLQQIGTRARGGRAGDWDPPLFETMLRALARDPSRLDHIAGLLEELRKNDRADELMPPGLDEVWGPIWQVRQEMNA